MVSEKLKCLHKTETPGILPPHGRQSSECFELEAILAFTASQMGAFKGTMQLISQQRCTQHSQLKMHTFLRTGIKLLLIIFLQAAKHHYISLPHKCSLWCLMDQTVLPNKRVCNQSLKYTNSWDQEGHLRFVTSRENTFPHPCVASHHNAATTFTINHSSQMLAFPLEGFESTTHDESKLSLSVSLAPSHKLQAFSFCVGEASSSSS